MATSPPQGGEWPLQSEYVRQFEEQAWRPHHTFTAALASEPDPREDTAP